MLKVTRFLQGIFRRFGVNVTRARLQDIPFESLPGGAPKTVLDIGANKGQFARKILASLPDAHIYSFEPLPGPYNELQGLALNNKKLHCFNVAIGSTSGRATMYTGSYTPSSSLFKPSNILSSILPDVVPTTTTVIDIVTLDTAVETIEITKPLFVKIDVQGFEKEVILGGRETLINASAIFVELSFDEIYEGQPLFFDIVKELDQLNFFLVDIVNISRNPKSGFAFQCEGLFINGSNTRKTC